jgi:hypothetical protein
LRRTVAATFVALVATTLAASPAWASAPDAPTAPTAVAGNGQITVTFSAPDSDGGNAITAYNATCTSSNGGTTAKAANSGMVTPIVVTGLSNGKGYTCTVDASNMDGTSPESEPSSPAVVPSTVPDAPATPTVSPGNAEIVVSFSPPADNGNSIISYDATCTGGGSPVTRSGTSSPIIVFGLVNGTSYTCTVDATNGDGTSAESPPSAAAVPATVPDAPLSPSVAASGTQITVTFAPPANNGGSAITSFTATCGGGAAPVEVSAASSPIIVGGLVRGTTYMCTVTATNALGTSQPSPDSPPITVPAAVPNAPARPTVERGNTKVTVTFAPPANNGSPITSYTATCSGLSATNHVSMSGTSSPIVVAGLANGTKYTCTVTATNAVGTGALSKASGSVIPAAVPDAPSQPTVARGIALIVVSFSKATNQGSAITGYTATCTSTNGGRGGSHSSRGSPIIVTGLTNGRIYTCYVTATNHVGIGPRSVPSVPTVPGTAPSPPTIMSVVSGRAPGPVGPLVVSFKAGSDNGTPISSYRATCTPSGGAPQAVTSTGTPITVPGLTTGVGYTCAVVAISASGTSRSSHALSATVGTPGIPKLESISGHVRGLTITFVVPSNNGDPILHFHAVCTSTNGGETASEFSRGSPFPLNGLTPGGRYSCALTAINRRGASPSVTAGPVRVPF